MNTGDCALCGLKWIIVLCTNTEYWALCGLTWGILVAAAVTVPSVHAEDMDARETAVITALLVVYVLYAYLRRDQTAGYKTWCVMLAYFAAALMWTRASDDGSDYAFIVAGAVVLPAVWSQQRLRWCARANVIDDGNPASASSPV